MLIAPQRRVIVSIFTVLMVISALSVFQIWKELNNDSYDFNMLQINALGIPDLGNLEIARWIAELLARLIDLL